MHMEPIRFGGFYDAVYDCTGFCSIYGFKEKKVLSADSKGTNGLLPDFQDGAEASMLCYTIIEMAKTYNLKIYDYILFLLSERPSKDMTDEELDKLSP